MKAGGKLLQQVCVSPAQPTMALVKRMRTTEPIEPSQPTENSETTLHASAGSADLNDAVCEVSEESEAPGSLGASDVLQEAGNQDVASCAMDLASEAMDVASKQLQLGPGLPSMSSTLEKAMMLAKAFERKLADLQQQNNKLIMAQQESELLKLNQQLQNDNQSLTAKVIARNIDYNNLQQTNAKLTDDLKEAVEKLAKTTNLPGAVTCTEAVADPRELKDIKRALEISRTANKDLRQQAEAHMKRIDELEKTVMNLHHAAQQPHSQLYVSGAPHLSSPSSTSSTSSPHVASSSSSMTALLGSEQLAETYRRYTSMVSAQPSIQTPYGVQQTAYQPAVWQSASHPSHPTQAQAQQTPRQPVQAQAQQASHPYPELVTRGSDVWTLLVGKSKVPYYACPGRDPVWAVHMFK